MTNWLKNLRAKLSGRSRTMPIQTRKPFAKRRLLLERLEDRVTPSTLSLSSGTLTYQAASSETNNLTVSYSSATQKYTFADTGANITCSISGETGSGTHTVSVSAASVSAVSIDLSANSNNDTANIESNNAATTVETGAGINTVNVSSNGSTLTGNLAGIADPLAVTSTNGGKVSLVMSNFSATTGDSNVVVGASTITGFGPSTINYNTATGGSFNLVKLIGSNSPGLAEQFTVNDPNAGTFQLDSEAGGDTAIIEGTNSGSTNNINMGAGAATVTVSSNGLSTGSLDNILGTLNINEGTGSGKTLNLIDYGGSGGQNVTVNGTTVTGFTPPTINYRAVGGTFSNITLSASNTGSDTFTVTGNSPAVNLKANGGGDTFVLENNATVKSIAGGAGTDTLSYGSGYTNPVSVTLAGSNSTGFSSSSATGITNGFTGIDVLNGTNSSTLTGDSGVSTWTINAIASNSTYADGSESLAFSGFSTLDGGSGGSTFNLQSGTSGYTINGYSDDTLSGVSDAVLSSSAATGFSGSAASSISFTNIGTLDGSGSLTGENTDSTWTVSATPSYSDGSNTLDFSGFSTLDGGTGGNTFNVSGGASGYTINGNTGTDTLTGVSNAVLTSSTSSGFSGTAANSITFSDIDVLDGSGSLTGENTASTWTVSATPSYSDGSNTLAFSGFSTLDGGTGGNTFNVSGGVSGYTINGNTGTDTLTGVSNAVLTSSTSSGFSGTAASSITFSEIDVLDGSGSLTGENTASTWTVAPLDSDNSTYTDGSDDLTFSGFSTLDGGTAADTFNLASGATGYTISGGGASSGTDTLTGVSNAVLTGSSSTGFSGSANGGAAPTGITFSDIDTLDGSGSLTGDSGVSTWTINAIASNSTYNDISESLTFSGFSTLDGGTGGSTFNLQSGASGYTINGYSDDTLTGVSDAVLDGSSATGFSGSAASSISFSNIGTLDGTGSLTGENTASTWTVSATPSYSDGSNTLDFSGFSTLDGGTGGNTFNLQSGASGYTINGYSDDTLTGVSNAVLSGSTATGFSGSAASSISFSNIGTLDGSGSLTGDSGVSTWTIDAIASNSTYNDISESLTFSGFSTLDGGTGGSTFNLQSGASGYTINGYSDDTLTGVSDAVLDGSSATGFSGSAASSISFSNIGTLDGTGSLTGEKTPSTWTVSATPSYSDGSNTLDFSGFSTLDGGSGGNTFNVSGGASGYTINGYSDDTLTGVSDVVLSGSTATGFSGSAASSISFTNIGTLDGSGSLTGENTASTWTVALLDSDNSTYADPNHSLTFSGFSTLDGGTAADTFNLASGATGYTINGGGASSGTDTLTGVSNAVLTGSSSTGFSGSANGGAAPTGISFSNIGTLDGSGSLTGDSGVSTWTINAIASNSTYADPNHSLTFSGFSTLDGGTGGNTFNLQSGASGYTINGYSDDTLTGVSNAVLSGSTATGFSGSAASSISFSNIGTLDGSGSLTGDSGVSTWTVNAITSNSTYNDSSESLTFSGFSTLDAGNGHNTFDFASGATFAFSSPDGQTVAIGQTATFTTDGTGTPTPTIQWQVSSDDGSTWSNISGATTTSLTVTATQAQNGNLYRALFSNSTGQAATAAATLFAFSSPTSQTVAIGQTATFTTDGTGTPTIQWQVSSDDGSTWSNISGATTTSLTVTATQAQNGNLYRALFSNSTGQAATAAATLTVTPTVQANTFPQTLTVAAGTQVTLTAAATGDPVPSVQWTVSTNGGKTFSAITGATSTSYSFAALAGDSGQMFEAVFSNGIGKAVPTAPVTLTVDTAPAIMTSPTAQTAAVGGTATFTASASGNPAPTVQWMVSTDGGHTFTNVPGGMSAKLTLSTLTASQNGGLYRAVFLNAVGQAASAAAKLTVQFAPTVTQQPTSQTVAAGTRVTFTAASNADPTATVQWMVSTNAGKTFTAITGATSTSYSLTAQTSNSGWMFEAVFTNSIGKATTSAAMLTIDVPPGVQANPTNQTAASGAATFSVVPTGTSPTVQWQVSTNGGSTWTNVTAGGTSATLALTGLTSAQDQSQYRVLVTNALGTFTSAAAKLTVQFAPTVTQQPTSQTVASGTQVTLTAAATGDPVPSVQWMVSTNAGKTFTAITGATSTSYSLTAQTSNSGRMFEAVFTNSVGKATTSAAMLTIDVPPGVQANPTNQTAASGAATFSVVPTGTSPTVQWQVSTNGGSTWSNVTTGGTSATLALTGLTSAQDQSQYRVLVTNALGTFTSAAAKLTVQFAPVVTKQPTSQTVAAGTRVTFTAASNADPTATVQWMVSTNGGKTFTAITGATSTSYSLTAQTSNSGWMFEAVFTNSVGKATTSAAMLTIDVPPGVQANPTNQTAASGAATFSVVPTGTSPTVQWQVSTNGGSTWSNVTTGGTSATLALTGLTSAQDQSQYRVLVTNALGTFTSAAAKLTVQFAPVVTKQPTSQTVAAGTRVTFTAASNADPTATVQWMVSTNGGKTFTAITGATSTSYSLTAQTSNSGWMFEAVFTNSIGKATTSAAMLTIDVPPGVQANPTNQTAASGAATFSVVPTGTSPTVQWQVSTNGGSTWSNVTTGGTSATLALTGLTSAQDQSQYRVLVTNALGTFTSAAATLTVPYGPIITA